MDFKGITWAGNIYQKFEAMCLEVEEAMYQDTVKYVENQVQKVGVSVKKFYSEVIEDLRPPSCVDPNLSSGELSPDPYGDADIIKKPTPSISDSHPNKENEDQVTTNVIAKKESFLSGNYNISSLSPRNKCTDSRAVTNKRLGIHRRAIGIKRIPKNNHPSKDSCRIMSSSDDLNATSSGELDVIRKASPVSGTSVESTASEEILADESLKLNEDDSGFVSPASGKRSSAESVRENKNDFDSFIPAFENNLSAEPVRENKNDFDSFIPAFENNLSAEPVRENKTDFGSFIPAFESNLSAESERLEADPESTSFGSRLPTESTGTTKNQTSFSENITSKTSNLESEEAMVSNEGTSMNEGSSSVSTTSCNVPWKKEIIMPNGDSFNMDVIENEGKNLKPVEREILGESCIVVEDDEIYFIPPDSRRHKSYKKKIREALSSKLKLKKDHKSPGGKINEETMIRVCSMDPQKKELTAYGSLESDWELL